MSTGNYSVYHYDTSDRVAGDSIIQDVDINRAHREAKNHVKQMAGRRKKNWKEVPAGENRVFQIEGERMGFIVMKNNAGIDYETALKSQTKAMGQ